MPSTWPTEALKAQAIAARSYAARRLRPGVSYYDVNDDTRSQVYRGAEGETADDERASSRRRPAVVLRSGTVDRQHAVPLDRRRRDREQRERLLVGDGRQGRGAGQLPARVDATGAPDGTSYDAASPYATWTTQTYTRAQLSAWFAADARTNVGTLTALDLRDRGVSGRLISVTLIGSAGTKTVSGDVFRSVFNAGRPAADPMLRSTLFATAPIP